ncbi:MAG TPA: flagellar biosynthesis protein FliQ [Acidobacteriota bacterium]|nr:flagellar biosynthesis protein FliQ [Acidobacteriota bacterium]
MSQEMVIKLVKDALQITMMVGGPLLLICLVVGICISIVQVVTSIQDMTLTLVPKIIAVFIGLLVLFPWIMNIMLAFTAQLFGNLERYVR